MLMRYKSLWKALRAFPHFGYSSSSLNINSVLFSATDKSVPKATEIAKRLPDENANKKKGVLVSAAFTSLQNEQLNSELDEKIDSADNVDSLLSLTARNDLLRNHALKIVSTLADWTSENKLKLIDYESDPRFINLCRILGHQVSTRSLKKSLKIDPSSPTQFTDLGVVLGVAGDDEAAKLVNTITVPQMIKVLLSLAYKKRRSIPLLRSLAFNIGKSGDEINIKDCADVLYASAQLSFNDEVLFEKICSDLSICIEKNNKPAVIGSIITSLGLLKYKDIELLDLICEWVMKNVSVCRIQDLTSLVLTLASVNHIPANGDELFKKLETHLHQSDVSSPCLWLDVVWALVILNKANCDHLSSVLNQEFIGRLGDSLQNGLSLISKIKLLNINGAAKLCYNNYSGPLLVDESEITKVEVPRGKDKQILVASVLDSLINLLPSAAYMNTKINSGMGFIIDGEFVVDANITPLPLVDKKSGLQIDRSQPGVRKGTKIGILVLDYHDITKGVQDTSGIASLAINLTNKMGYKVITVPYYEFNPKEKLVMRVQYLEQKLKNMIKNNQNIINVQSSSLLNY